MEEILLSPLIQETLIEIRENTNREIQRILNTILAQNGIKDGGWTLSSDGTKLVKQ
jgi:hypothetical protein